MQENIHTTFDQLLTRADKEKLIGQKSRVIWLTGLSGSGKSSIAQSLEKQLNEMDFLTQVLDGDNVRTGINNNLGFSEADRTENIRRIAEVSKLFLNAGVITINTFVSPTNAIRKQARKIIGDDDFLEIYVNCPLEVCEKRDVKGLYAKARAGEIPDFTGVSSPFEAPENPDFEIKTDFYNLEESTEFVLKFILPKILYKK